MVTTTFFEVWEAVRELAFNGTGSDNVVDSSALGFVHLPVFGKGVNCI